MLSHLHLVEQYTRRYAWRGVATEDLRQAATLALVEAAARFDPELGTNFAAFASVTIDGSLKRYFRDRTWTVRPPRALVELHLKVRRASEELRHGLGREPTIAELAVHLRVDQDHIHQAMEASAAHSGCSLDSPFVDSDEQAGPWLRCEDPGFDRSDSRIDLRRALSHLAEDERELVRLRFLEGWSQQQMSEHLGLSQSYVSRLINGVLLRLRAAMADPDGGAPAHTKGRPRRTRRPSSVVAHRPA